MKKLIISFCAILFIIGAIGLAQGHQDWAIYKNKPVPEDVKIPLRFIDPVDGTLNCCGCHGRLPSAPPMPGTCP